MTEKIGNKKTGEFLSGTEILIMVEQVVNSNLELKEMLDAITHIVAERLNKDTCTVYLIKPDTKVIYIEASKGLEKEAAGMVSLTPGEGVIGWVAQQLQPLGIEDIRKEPRFKKIALTGEGNFLSMLAVPISRDNEPLGVLTVQTIEPYMYSEEEINLLNIISHKISTAIKNAEFYKNFKIQVDELKTLNEIGKAITSILSIDKLLPYICEEVSKLFHAKGCILRLLEDDILQIKASYGLPDKIKQAMNLRIGEGIAGWVVQTGKPLLVDDVLKMPENLRVPVIEATSVLCVPLKIGERTIGTLGLYDKEDEWGTTTFTQADLDTLNTFASASSIAIENARLYRTEVEKERKILSLYWEVTQIKDYLESLIDNSADAIVVSDRDGSIISWNKGAEKIYGYAEEEVVGKFLPMVPYFLVQDEKNFINKIIQKETIKNIETIRQTKIGELIEVSLTLSPILDASGNVTAISGISRDISEKKRVEKELIRKNQELSRLFFINSVIRSTLDLEKLLRMVLTVVTMSDGLGFNRAVLFLVDETQNTVKGVMGVGPANAEEAGYIWLSLENKTLETIIEEIERGPLDKDSYLDRLSKNINITFSGDCIISRCVKEKRPFNIKDAKAEPQVNPIIIQQIGTEAFGVVPLITRDRAIGVILVDNLFTGKEIKDSDLQFIMGFTSHIASAIENAKLFEEVSLARAELDNIFESITDMVYFNDKDCNIKRVNQAVLKKIGKPAEEIIDKKCYEIFHGKDEPWDKCPHSRTIGTNKAFVEEVKDPFLGGTYVISSSPIFDSAGNLVGTVHISRDITELQALREELSVSQRMAALGEMAARVAHEIRNPLISVGGFARRLAKKVSGDVETYDYAKIIIEEVSRLERILKEILIFVKGSKIIKNKTNLNELLNNAINLIMPEIMERGNNLIADLPEQPIIVVVDADRIKEAILNIITNANQATDSGTIIVKARYEGKSAFMEISDNGCGIKQEELNRIFTPFFTTRPHGTGLGLAIAQRIVHEHGGRIDVESIWGGLREDDEDITAKGGGGTTFKIYLPLDEV
ncbi:MAG: GAF domain-containing protein [Nitrospirota bacterium]